jgi:hypothetical protein
MHGIVSQQDVVNNVFWPISSTAALELLKRDHLCSKWCGEVISQERRYGIIVNVGYMHFVCVSFARDFI